MWKEDNAVTNGIRTWIISSSIENSKEKIATLQKKGFTRAAVLVPMYRQSHEIYAIYIRRSRSLRKDGMEAAHSGQIAFPGGKLEKGEEPLQAALREAREEVGLVADRVEVLGELGPFLTLNSRHVIQAYLGWVKKRPALCKNAAEVADIFHIPLAMLLPQHRPELSFYSYRDFLRLHYHWQPEHATHEICIWGMTGQITWTLLQGLRGMLSETRLA